MNLRRIFIWARAIVGVPAVLFVAVNIWAEATKTPRPWAEPTPEIVEQERARAEQQTLARERARQQGALETERARFLCHQKAMCWKFGEARQACATAGNYKHCIDIKMGNEAIDGLYPCMNDGSVWADPQDMPGQLMCFLHLEVGERFFQ
jgi:hypothetical protein